MRTRSFCGVFAAIAMLPGVSFAQFNYTAIELSLVDVEFDFGRFSVDGDGFAVGGTFEVAESFYLGGSYEDYDLDFGIDAEVLEIGGGYFHNLNETLDFVATLGFVDVEASSGNARADDDGLTIGGGVRFAVSEDFEVDAMFEFTDFDEGDSDSGLELRGRYYFSENFALGAQIDLGKDVETLRIGLRFEF